jgi:hypothetical protein
MKGNQAKTATSLILTTFDQGRVPQSAKEFVLSIIGNPLPAGLKASNPTPLIN